METLIEDICEKTGLDRATAQRVAGYLKANVTRIPQLLQAGDGANGPKNVASNIVNKIGDASRR